MNITIGLLKQDLKPKMKLRKDSLKDKKEISAC